ncbi:glycosyltransferase, partial [Mesorhizobium sp.]|uniref:glycosyltransferase n=1 Tax=Mesorhizobium sp. TaxID=1871066 RepID=UPI0025B9A317
MLSAFRTLRPYSYKADLAKYCLLYEQGGLYADLSYFFLRGVPRADGKLSIFRDFLSSTPWDTSIGVVAAPPR